MQEIVTLFYILLLISVFVNLTVSQIPALTTQEKHRTESSQRKGFNINNLTN